MSPFVNSRIQDFGASANQLPRGFQTFNSVPFDIVGGSGNDVWRADIPVGSNPREIVIPIGAFGVDSVHTLINTLYGQTGPNAYTTLTFTGSQGASFVKPLVGNVDIRDYLFSGWTNSINNTTTKNAVSVGAGFHNVTRLDQQFIALPSSFLNQTLVSIRVSDTGGFNFQRTLLSAVTVHGAVAAPEPASLSLLLSVAVGTLAWRRRALRS